MNNKLNILVFGHYGHHNCGDNLFIDSFRYLFPNYNLFFTDIITEDKLKDIDTIFVGGGSFLSAKPEITNQAFNILKEKKIFYLGIGVEDYIYPTHLELLKIAELIAFRSPSQQDKINSINPKNILISDLVFALKEKVTISAKVNKSVLIIPNLYVVPKYNDPFWKHAAWNYFKSEFCQFLDYLIDNKYQLSFFPMSISDTVDDNFAAVELQSFMKNRRHYPTYSFSSAQEFECATSLFSQYETVITQRFHGIVLSELTDTKYIALHHHDKLLDCAPNNRGEFISYYNLNKNMLIQKFHQLEKTNLSEANINQDTFNSMVDQVNKNLEK